MCLLISSSLSSLLAKENEMPEDLSISSRFLDLWIFVRQHDGEQWRALVSKGPNVVVNQEEHEELTQKGYDHSIYQAIPFLTFLYRIHPQVGDQYRFYMEKNTIHTLGLVLAIDGCNTINSRLVRGTDKDNMWVLSDSDTDTTWYITGWQATKTKALQFEFVESGSQPVHCEGGIGGQISAYIFFPDDWEQVKHELLTIKDNPWVAFNEEFERDIIASYNRTGAGNIVDYIVTPADFIGSLTEKPIEKILISYAAKKQTYLGIVGRTNPYIGVTILYVAPYSPAYRANLKPGQIISKADGKIIRSVKELRNLILNKEPGDWISLQVHDKDFTKTIDIGPVQLDEW